MSAQDECLREVTSGLGVAHALSDLQRLAVAESRNKERHYARAV